MKRTLIAATLGLALGLSACAGKPAPTPEASPTPSQSESHPEPPVTEPEETVEPVAVTVQHKWAQDLWLFNAVRYFTEAGTEVDATKALPHYINDWEPDQTFQVADGVEFKTYDRLKPSIVSEDGSVRTDVEVLAGMMTFDEEEVFAVLATPDAEAAAPIGHGDNVEVDFTFLGSNFYPGLPMSFDFSFMQTWPGDDGDTVGSLDLLKTRLAKERVNFYGTEADDGPELLMFSNAMGTAVEGSSRMRMGGKQKISDPGLRGFRDGAWAGRKGGLGGVRGFYKKFNAGAKGSNDLIRCNLGGPCGDPPEWTPPPGQICFGYSCGSASGDPHLETLDGLAYSPQAVGEFILVHSPELQVHMRTAPMGSSTTVSVVTGVAVKADGQHIAVAINDGKSELFVSGLNVPLPEQPKEFTLGDVTVTGSKDRVQIVTTGGELITVVLGSSQLAVFVDTGKLNELTGMLGNGNGDPDDDLVSRDGTPIALDLIKKDPSAFYGTYVNSWRVTQEESLFVYKSGQDTAFFTDLDFPSEHSSLDTIDDKELKLAKAVCERAGVERSPYLDNCIFDYWASGNIDFVTMARQVDLLDGISSGYYQVEEPAAPNQGVPAEIPDGHGPKDGQTVEEYVEAQWSWSPHSRYSEPDEFEHYCPAGGEPTLRIWGGGAQGYTSDTSVCTAAVHAGVITPQTGGLLNVVMVEGQDSYETPPQANGVTPVDWFRNWSYGYLFK